MNRLSQTARMSLFMLLLPLAAVAEVPSKDYVNARFGFKIRYPATLVASPEPTNGGGREFHTKDHEFSLAASAYFVNDTTLETLWKQELAELGSSITYKMKDQHWYVVSGARNGMEFYHKTHVQDGTCAAFQITYPHAKAKQYDPWVESIARSFVPFLKGEYDRIQK